MKKKMEKFHKMPNTEKKCGLDELLISDCENKDNCNNCKCNGCKSSIDCIDCYEYFLRIIPDHRFFDLPLQTSIREQNALKTFVPFYLHRFFQEHNSWTSFFF